MEIKYTDPSKNLNLQDQELNTSTDLTLIGRNYKGGYTKYIAENFLHLLENFAYSIPPTNPTLGQVWFSTAPSTTDSFSNTSVDSYGLKVYDGTTWLPLGVIKKSTQAPSNLGAEGTNLKEGDLYVDTARKQLWMFTGGQNAPWTLIGPQFNQTEKTGSEVELIIDSNNNQAVPVLTIFVKARRIVIISDFEFTPKSFVEGFSTIKKGINLSTKLATTSSIPLKFYGIAEKSEALISGDEIVSAKNFLRSDQTSTTNYGFNVRNNNGINIGNDLSLNVSVDANGAYLYNKLGGSSIDLRVFRSNNVLSILTVRGDNSGNVQWGSVGINNTAPQESLDIRGNARATGKFISTSTDVSSITTSGGAFIAGPTSVGGTLTVQGTSTTKSIEPTTSNTFNLGSLTKKWSTIYANTVGTESSPCNFYGVFDGTFTGILSGASTGFRNPINLSITGDVASTNSVQIQEDGKTLVFEAYLRPGVIGDKSEVGNFFQTDEMLIQRGNSQLYKIKKATMISSMPLVQVGTILLFAGDDNQIPKDYLLCNGAEKAVNDYKFLFDVIRYKYKDSSLIVNKNPPHFAVPNLASAVPMAGTHYIIYTGNTV